MYISPRVRYDRKNANNSVMLPHMVTLPHIPGEGEAFQDVTPAHRPYFELCVSVIFPFSCYDRFHCMCTSAFHAVI